MIIQYQTVKPLFKYIGGKSWLKEQLQEESFKLLSNKKYNSYCEPFCGGLGAFLNIYDVLLLHNVKNIQLNDVSTPLNALYNSIYYDKESLINHYENLEKQFNRLALNAPPNKEILKKELLLANNFFAEQKKSFNILKKSSNNQSLLAATLIFLQKHSFNGIYRENLKGEYNTPFNWDWKKTDIESAKSRIEEIYKVFNLFKKVEFTNFSYDELEYKKSTFYYLDPPYLNEENLGENKYSSQSFGPIQQLDLIAKIKDVNFLYSNHKSSFLLSEFENNVSSYSVRTIKRKNIMSSKASTRGADKEEILISR